ncbi:MAG: hypothetical protein GY765_31400 [bacterium]|nr:hypothetical protein [bacterium]
MIKKNTVFRIVFLIGSICFAIISVEVLMRLFYEPTTTLNPDILPDRFGKYPYLPPKNALGFREVPPGDEIFRDNYKRILLLGDSFTFGHGIKKGADRFSDIIEDRLNREPKENGFHYHLYNAGIDGTEPKDWVPFLNTLLPVYKPHNVFAVFFLRDGTDLCTSLLCHKKKIKSLKAKYENTIWYKYSYMGKYIGTKLLEKEFSDYYLTRMRNAYLGSEEEKQPWYEQQKYLREIVTICKHEKIEFRLVLFPLLFGLESNYQFYDVENEISRFAKDNGMEVFSLIKGFIGHNSKSLWVAPGNQHPNEKGHKIAADTFYPYVRNVLND